MIWQALKVFRSRGVRKALQNSSNQETTLLRVSELVHKLCEIELRGADYDKPKWILASAFNGDICLLRFDLVAAVAIEVNIRKQNEEEGGLGDLIISVATYAAKHKLIRMREFLLQNLILIDLPKP